MCGAPRTFFVQALIMSSTGLEQPKIVDDYTHIFDDPEAKRMWTRLVANLTAFGAIVDARNAVREAAGKRAFRVFETANIETSLGI